MTCASCDLPIAIEQLSFFKFAFVTRSMYVYNDARMGSVLPGPVW
jgi:hypothetical protein